MAVVVISTLTSTQTTLNTGDDYVLLEGVTHYVTTANSVVDVPAVNDVEITVLGALVSPQYTAISATADDLAITVGAQGTISASENFRPIFSTGNDVRVFNAGTISGGQIELLGLGNSFINTGTVFGTSPFFSVGAVRMTAADATIVNHGLISSTSEAVLTVSGTTRITNTGTISGIEDAIKASFLTVSETLTLFNSGTIAAGVEALVTGLGADVIVNSGTIEGDVFLSGGADQVRGMGGTISGVLNTGAGDDTVYIDDANATVEGGNGTDTLYSRADIRYATGFENINLLGGDNLAAYADDSTILMQGNAGNNDLVGSDAATQFNAGPGDDVISGLGGNDTLRGNTGNDVLIAGDGDDFLFGGIGDDTMTGGIGRDIHFGQQGADVHVFDSINESPVGSGRDVLVGFERGTDRIDLSGINQEAFAFVGTAGFSAGGGMELRYEILPGTQHALVQMDSDGDGLADAEILVRGNPVLSAEDFVL